jgi:hypothetical protein
MLFLKPDVNVPSKSNKQIIFLVGILKATDENSWIGIRIRFASRWYGMRIRIRLKTSRIHNTVTSRYGSHGLDLDRHLRPPVKYFSSCLVSQKFRFLNFETKSKPNNIEYLTTYIELKWFLPSISFLGEPPLHPPPWSPDSCQRQLDLHPASLLLSVKSITG